VTEPDASYCEECGAYVGQTLLTSPVLCMDCAPDMEHTGEEDLDEDGPELEPDRGDTLWPA